MDSRDRDHRLLAAFLAGELDPAAARRWDAHLLECEQCWRAVREDRTGRQAARLLRRPAPPELADRVAFAVERTAAGAAGQRPARAPAQPRRRARPGRRLRGRWLAAAGTGAAALLVTLIVSLVPGGYQAQSVPAAVAAVARYARTVPSPAVAPGAHPDRQVVPVGVGRPVTVTAGGQQIVVRTWPLGSPQAGWAGSCRPLSLPARAPGRSVI